MPTPAHPMDSIERFAEICAVLDDGFTDRAAALRAAGFDAAAWAMNVVTLGLFAGLAVIVPREARS